MKKRYCTPEITMVKVESCAIMQAVSGTLDKNQTITNSNNFGSRRGGSFFDDDDDWD